MPDAANDLLTTLLRDVSRSFYLTLRVLPASIRPQIGLAYLLARATDTIADTGMVPLDQRLAALRRLRAAILANSPEPHNRDHEADFTALARQQGSPAERSLLERMSEALAVLRGFNAEDRQRVRDVLATITSGQELDLQRFQGASADRVMALQTDAELDDYTYRVAGCVGEFWTKMCRAHVFPDDALDDARLLADGVRFGKGLQLVNILRDLPRDLRQGRCYLPMGRLAAAGLLPADLLDAAKEPRLRPLYDEHLALAWSHLEAGWAYTCALPWRCARVRLACSWPVLIGFQTLRRLAVAPVLGGAEPVKISRGAVKRLMAGTIFLYPLPQMWQKLPPQRHPGFAQVLMRQRPVK